MYQNPYAPPGFGGYRPTMMQQTVQQPIYQQQMQQTQMQTQAPVQQSTVTMVTSKAQADVAQVPFDGQTYFFMDTSNRRMYAKSFDPNTGMCPMVEYAPVMEENPPQYATVQMLSEMENRLTAMLKTNEAEVRQTRRKKEDSEE